MNKRSVPDMTTDEEAEAFLDEDLSDLDFTQFEKLDWERMPKTARITLRVPEPLVEALKARAKERGIPYQRLLREAIEKAV
jgi:predicted DNA binding CopG/RHH family protein